MLKSFIVIDIRPCVRAWVLSRFSSVGLFATPWTVPCQAPLSMQLSRQGYCSGLLCPPPGDLPHPRMEPMSLTSSALAGKFFTTSTTWEAPSWSIKDVKYQNLQFLRTKHLKPRHKDKTHGTRKTQLIRDRKRQPMNAPGN